MPTPPAVETFPDELDPDMPGRWWTDEIVNTGVLSGQGVDDLSTPLPNQLPVYVDEYPTGHGEPFYPVTDKIRDMAAGYPAALSISFTFDPAGSAAHFPGRPIKTARA